MREMHSGVTDQSKAAKHRLEDARALLNSIRCRGAMYMSGYAIECLLKAKLMRMFDCRNLEELEEYLHRHRKLAERRTIFTHELELLLRTADGVDRLRQNAENWKLFNLVNRWIPAWRYSPDLSNEDDATDFLDAVKQIAHWIEHNI